MGKEQMILLTDRALKSHFEEVSSSFSFAHVQRLHHRGLQGINIISTSIHGTLSQ